MQLCWKFSGQPGTTPRIWPDLARPAHSEPAAGAQVGYQLENGDGEFATATEAGGQTDRFGSYPVFQAESGAYSTELGELIPSGAPPIDRNRLADYFQFGYGALGEGTIYHGIRQFPATAPAATATKAQETDPGVSPSQLLRQAIEARLARFGNGPVIVPISAGHDSGVLLEHLHALGAERVVCATFGPPDCDDVLVGRQRAELCGYPHHHWDILADLSDEETRELLEFYAKATAGIGPATEILFAAFARRVANEGNIFILGGAGEFYRDYLKSKDWFGENYLTPDATLRRYTEFRTDPAGMLRRIEESLGEENTLRAFYIHERYPKNMNRKNQVLKSLGTPVNPFSDSALFDSVGEQASTGDTLDFLRPETRVTGFPYPHKTTTPLFNVRSFLAKVREAFLELLDATLPFENFGLKPEAIRSDVANQAASDRDIWFLSRLLNLLTFLRSHLQATPFRA